MPPHPANASASSSRGPRAAGSGCISSHQPYASGVATASGGSVRAPSAGAAGGGGGRDSPPPPPPPGAGRGPPARKAPPAPGPAGEGGEPGAGGAVPGAALTT